MDAVRSFLVRTLLEDNAGKGIDLTVAKAKALTEKAIVLTFKTSTTEVEKQIKSLYKTIESVPKDVTTEVVRKSGDAIKGFAGHIENLGKTTNKTAQSIGDFFKNLDTGRLILGAAGAGLAVYAGQLVQTYDSFRLNIEMIKEQAGALAPYLTSFVMGGPSTMSMASKASLASYMEMVGYDKAKISGTIANAAIVMRSTFGAQLQQQFGIKNEADLVKTMSEQMDPSSPLARAIRKYAPSFYSKFELQKEVALVTQDPKFAYQDPRLIQQEAQRRLAQKALKTMADTVTPDTDSYRVAMLDMGIATENLKTKIGDTLNPAITLFATFITTVMRIAEAHPVITTIVGALIGLGIALSTLGVVLPFVSAGVKALTVSLMANPFVLAAAAIAILIVGLAALESRFHIVSRAVDYFSKSQIGQDLIGGVKSLLDYFGLLGKGDFFSGLIADGEALSKFIAGIFDQLDAIYKMAKGGDILGALGGAAKLAISMSPIGIAAALIESQLPLKRIQDEALSVLKSLKTVWDAFMRWLQTIWEGIVGLGTTFAEKLKPIADLLITIADKLGLGKGGPANQPTPIKMPEAPVEIGGKTINPTAHYKDTSLENPAVVPGWIVIQWYKKGEIGTEGLSNFSETGASLTPGLGYGETPEESEPLPGKGEEKGSGKVGTTTGLAHLFGKEIQIGQPNALESEYPVTSFQEGGEVKKTGWAIVDQGEPIIPAEVARSSTLIERLREIASGRDGGGDGGGRGVQIRDVIINLEGQQDAASISREIKSALEKEFSDYAFGERVEKFVHRANRAYFS